MNFIQSLKSIDTKLILILVFISTGILSSYISTFLCWLFLDNMQCYIQLPCELWDKFEYVIAHKVLSFSFYYVGLYGFIGSLLYYIESRYFKNIFSKILDYLGNVFGWVVTTIISYFIISPLANILQLYNLFELLYNVFN